MNTYIITIPGLDVGATKMNLISCKVTSSIYSGHMKDSTIWTIKCNQDDLPWVLLKTNGTIRAR